MFGPKIKLDKELFEKAKTCAESAGYLLEESSDFIRSSFGRVHRDAT